MDPSPSIREVEFYIDEHLRLVSELTTSVKALRATLSEQIPAFNETYARHYESAKTDARNRISPEAIAQFQRDIHRILAVIVEVYDRN